MPIKPFKNQQILHVFLGELTDVAKYYWDVADELPPAGDQGGVIKIALRKFGNEINNLAMVLSQNKEKLCEDNTKIQRG